MRVVAFNGSPREDGNTAALMEMALEEIRKEGIETETVQVGGKEVRGCLACYKCFAKKDRRCSQKKDLVNDCIEKMIESDGIILGSPTYFCNVSAEMKGLIDRAGLVAKANGDMLRRKVGAAVVAVRRSGAAHVFNSINHFFTINQMIIPGSSYWNLGIGGDKGEVKKDEEGVRTMKTLGQNMAWLMRKLQ